MPYKGIKFLYQSLKVSLVQFYMIYHFYSVFTIVKSVKRNLLRVCRIMATAGGASSTPGAKGPRMCRAVVDLGGDILRDALYYQIKPTVIMSHVLASRYFRNHPLNTHQTSVLANASTKGDYSECDITLVYSLLRNLATSGSVLRPTAGWGILPVASNITLGDDIERIRDMRNKMYGHVATTALDDVTYNHYMAHLQSICTRMDTIHSGSLMSPTHRLITYSRTLSDIQIMCMDPDMEAKYTEELRRMKETDRETREQINELRGDISGIANTHHKRNAS